MSLDLLWVHRGQKASGYLTIFSMVQGTGNHLLPGKRKCPPGNSDFSNCSCSAQVVELWLHVSELDAVYHKQLSAQMLICQVGLTMFSCAERAHTQAESCLGCTVSTFSCCLTTISSLGLSTPLGTYHGGEEVQPADDNVNTTD